MRWKFKQYKRHLPSSSRQSPNPLYSRTSWQSYVIEHFSIFGFGLILIILLFLYFFLYSPTFNINRVKIEGTDRITAQIIDEKIIRWQLDQRRLLVFKQRNAFLFSTKWLRKNINAHYGFETLEIKKTLPHSLTVTIKEKIPEFIWSTGAMRYILAADGTAASKLDDTAVLVDIPTILDEQNSPIQPGDSVITPEKVVFIKTALLQLVDLDAITIASYSFPHRLSTQFTVHTENGYVIYFNTNKNFETQLTKLKTFLSTLELGKEPKEYIDLRIGDRVYSK
ncbi:MAG: hypothetical protein PHY34_01800 [Patescibacteria group bacterium]|nr:hypothetical protein [Patescibacteria group bacterium]